MAPTITVTLTGKPAEEVLHLAAYFGRAPAEMVATAVLETVRRAQIEREATAKGKLAQHLSVVMEAFRDADLMLAAREAVQWLESEVARLRAAVAPADPW